MDIDMETDMDFFTASETAPGLFHIKEPAGVHATLITGKERALLFDTGYGFCDIRTAVRKLTDLPLVVVNSHCHMDHAGGNRFFDEVYAHPFEKRIYDGFQEDDEKRSLLHMVYRRYEQGKRPYPFPDDFDWEEYLNYQPCKFIPLKDRQSFDLGGRKAEVIFHPGHTRGCVEIFDHQSGILLSGDNIDQSLWIMFNSSASLDEYRAKLMDIRRHFPVTGILSSHFNRLYPPEFIGDMLRCIDGRNTAETSIFVHPRKGYKSLRRKMPIDNVPGAPAIYLVWPLDKSQLW